MLWKCNHALKQYLLVNLHGTLETIFARLLIFARYFIDFFFLLMYGRWSIQSESFLQLAIKYLQVFLLIPQCYWNLEFYIKTWLRQYFTLSCNVNDVYIVFVLICYFYTVIAHIQGLVWQMLQSIENISSVNTF